MNKTVFACITGGWLFCGACAHHPQQPSSQSQDSVSHPDTTTHSYFPIADALEGEIRQIDSMPVAIRKVVTRNGRKDSAFIKPAEFDALAAQFVAPEFRNGRFEKEFTESSFIDNATQDVTFTYSTTNRFLPLQRVDIIASPQGASHQVKSIYLEKNRTSGDSSILDKMYWRSGRQFQVIRLIRVKDGPPVQQQLIVSWAAGRTNEDNE
ncbi:MAG TPA: hypothetical protein VFE32_08435 [Puia sp.]|jgi:hypothetical protein|nr:hypothetical protein [Puia sp.]